MSRIVTLNIGASSAVLAEYVVKGKQGLTLTAYTSTDVVGLDWDAEGSAEAVLVPALREAAKSAGISLVVVDRGGFKYAGRVAAIVDAAVEAGLAISAKKEDK